MNKKACLLLFLSVFLLINIVYAGKDPVTLLPFDRGSKSNPKDAENLKKVPLRSQNDPRNGVIGASACGPTALGMAFEYFGKNIPTDQLIKESGMTVEEGSSIYSINKLANKYFPNSHFSYATVFLKDPLVYLKEQIDSGGLVIVPIAGRYSNKTAPEGHYLLVTDYNNGRVYANDPLDGTRVDISENHFLSLWTSKVKPKPCVVIKK